MIVIVTASSIAQNAPQRVEILAAKDDVLWVELCGQPGKFYTVHKTAILSVEVNQNLELKVKHE